MKVSSHGKFLLLATEGDHCPDLRYGLLAPREQLLVQRLLLLQDAARADLKHGYGGRENLQRRNVLMRI